jgi:tRNA (cmo5U34)-methyltransferase
MSVASHLNIPLDEYDARIRTFIPGYEQMLDAAARGLRALEMRSPVIVDLGTGTGALAARCLDAHSDARIVGIDEDPEILASARQRLASRGAVASFVQGSFLELPIPSCNAIVTSFALHHVRTAQRKQQLYRDCRDALSERGLFVTVDCFLASDATLAAIDRDAWRMHLRSSYSEADTDRYFAAWAQEDVYFTLDEELGMLRAARLAPDVIWRAGSFAVIVGRTR